MYNFQRFKRKVVCVGLNGSGANTLKSALTALGFKTLGWDEAVTPTAIGHLAEKRMQRLFKIAQDYDALIDMPWPLMFKELDKRYHNAKFILTTRKNETAWLETLKRQFKPAYRNEAIYGGAPQDAPDHFLAFYRRHNREVRAHFADRPEKLLEMCFDQGDAWAKLCPFLDIPVIPDVPMNSLNVGGGKGRKNRDAKPGKRAQKEVRAET